MADTKLTFLSLDDDCLLAILHQLPLKDLCSISQACKRLKCLAAKEFRRKYSSKWKHLKCKGIQVHTSPQEDYVACFKEHIKNIAAEFNNTEDNQHVALEILNSSKSVYQQILFNRIRFGEAVSASIACILHKVTSIGFNECTVNDDLYENVLQHCSSLKCLIFNRNRCRKLINRLSFGDNKWMLKTYPNLEQVQFHTFGIELFGEDDSIHENLPHFLEQNPTVKTFTWYLNHSRKTDQTLKAVISHGKGLEELFLSIALPRNLKTICKELKQLNEQSSIKRIELNFPEYHCSFYDLEVMSCFKSPMLKRVTGLHCFQLNSDIASLPNLTLLRFGFASPWDMRSIAPHLTNLEELILDGSRSRAPSWPRESYYDIQTHLTPFICSSPNLRKIIVNQNRGDVHDDANQIPQLHNLRKSLENATIVTIFFHKSVFEYFKKSIKLLEGHVDAVVKIKSSIFVENTMNIQNPFINFYCEEV